MKIIDLLNKIANGEAPEHIRIYNEDWYWNNYDGYVTKGSLNTTPDAQHYLFNQYRLDFVLDKEVEIIEEDKKIEKLESYISCGWNGTCKDLKREDLFSDLKKIGNKINEIIDYINGSNITLDSTKIVIDENIVKQYFEDINKEDI